MHDKLHQRVTSGEEVALPKKIFLVDGSNHAFRVFFAMPRMTAGGLNTGALLGFANMKIPTFARTIDARMQNIQAFANSIGDVDRTIDGKIEEHIKAQ